MEEAVIVVEAALENRALSCVTAARELLVMDPASYASAGDLLVTLRKLRKSMEQSFDPIITKLNAAHREALERKRQYVEPVDRAERMVKTAMRGYEDQTAATQARAQTALMAEARAEAERRRTEAVANLKRQGEFAAAAQMAAQALEVPAVFVPEATPQVDGVTSRLLYRALVIDFPALVAAVAAGEVPLAALKADLVFLNGQARALKQFLKYPGVRIEEERVMAVRA